MQADKTTGDSYTAGARSLAELIRRAGLLARRGAVFVRLDPGSAAGDWERHCWVSVAIGRYWGTTERRSFGVAFASVLPRWLVRSVVEI